MLIATLMGVLVMLPLAVSGADTLLTAERDALLKAASGISETEKKTLAAEALPDPAPFVVNYETSGGSANVKVDREKLMRFLRFQAPEAATACVSAAIPTACPACSRLRGALLKGLGERLARRGYRVKPVGGESEARGETAAEKLAERDGCQAGLHAEIVSDRSADEDHDAEDVKVRATAYFFTRQKIRAQAGAVATTDAQAGDADADKEAIARLVSPIVADLYAQVGGPSPLQAASASASSAKADGEGPAERLITISGFNGYAAYARFRQRLESLLPETQLQERIVRSGSIRLAVGGDLPLAEVARRLKAMTDPKVEVTGEQENEVAVVLK